LIANPKKGDSAKFDHRPMAIPLIEQAGIKASTMPRGDVAYFLLDYGVGFEEEMDRTMSILNKMNGLNPTFGGEDSLDIDFMRDFFAVSRLHTQVNITPKAMRILASDQVMKRTSDAGEMVSMRRIASLARLTQAAAKIDFKTEADIEHANFALSVMSAAQQDISPESVDGGIGEPQRRMKESIFSALEDAWTNNAPISGGWPSHSIPIYVEKFWNPEAGTPPSFSQVSEAIKAFTKEQIPSGHGEWRSYGKGYFGFEG
jgi:DNA replicative helicase MCM subunit Mcm2 (Cdc46/Mcm family)